MLQQEIKRHTMTAEVTKIIFSTTDRAVAGFASLQEQLQQGVSQSSFFGLDPDSSPETLVDNTDPTLILLMKYYISLSYTLKYQLEPTSYDTPYFTFDPNMGSALVQN